MNKYPKGNKKKINTYYITVYHIRREDSKNHDVKFAHLVV